MMAKEVPMTRDQREIHRKKRVLKYADKVGNINKACRYFGVSRSSFYESRNRTR
jgi:ACT domain-containing protein